MYLIIDISTGTTIATSKYLDAAKQIQAVFGGEEKCEISPCTWYNSSPSDKNLSEIIGR